MVDTIKFSEMMSGGDLSTDDKTPGLQGGVNVLFNNPAPNLAPGTTAERPAPGPEMYFRLRFNTTLESYEYYSPIYGWVQLEDSVDVQGFPFLIYTADPLLPSAFDLGTLSTGLLKQTVVAGVATPSIGVNGTDYYGPGFTGYFVAPLGIADINSNPIIHVNTAGASSVNYIGFTNSVTTDPVLIAPEGTDTDIELDIYAKGAGALGFGTTASTNAMAYNTGTAYQHITRFTFPDTANTVDVTWQDASGTVAYLSDITADVQSVTGTANQIDVDNTDPQNPILSLSATLDFPGTFTVQNTINIDAIIDDDTFATATDSNVPTAESVKAYVDGLDAGSVKSVTGTANEVDVDNTDPQNPVLSLSSTIDAPGTFTIQGTTAVDSIINDDTMATAAADNLATALSIKNYVDGLIGTSVLSVTGTANEIDVDNTDPQNPVLSLSSTLVAPGTIAVGNLLLSGNTLSSTDTDGNINLVPDGDGVLVLDWAKFPIADGTAGFVLSTDGAGQLAWVAQTAVTTPGGTNTQIQYNNSGAFGGDSGFTTDGSGNIDITGSLNVDNISIDGNTISSTNTNGDLALTPNGTGNLVLDGLNWPQADGSAGFFLSTDGMGNLNWSSGGGGGGYNWTEVTGTSQAMSVNSGYIANNAGLVTLTLPATANVGDTLIVQGKGAGGWRIAQNAGQTIHFGTSDTTTGAAGYLESTNRYDSIELICITADTEFAVLTGVQGVLTVV